MTIKEFANLCGCNTQTLRYYDRIGLLKPERVDPWSGYRYYDRSQAIDFVMIKNLQAADFSIGEIKILLSQTDEQVYDAFNRKIVQQEQKLERIRQIQQSYLSEKTNMEHIIQNMADFITGQLTQFDSLRQFGLDPKDGPEVVDRINAYMAKWIRRGLPGDREVTLRINEEFVHGADQVAERIQSLTDENLTDTVLLGDEDTATGVGFDREEYESIWESHGWDHAWEPLDAMPELKAEEEYCFDLRLSAALYREEEVSYPLFLLGALILRRDAEEVCMSCTVDRSGDEQNHFVVLRKK